MTILTGCGNKYRPVTFIAEDGYTVSYDQSESIFLIKKSDGTAIGQIYPNGWWSTNEKGENVYSGIRKDDNFIEIDIRLKPEYDPKTLTVTVNDKESVHEGTSSYIQSVMKGEELYEEYFTLFSYKYETNSSEKDFNVNIGGIKVLTIGGNKWRLHGVKEGEIHCIYGGIYDNLVVGKGLDCRFDFREDGSVLAMLKGGDEVISENGTWTEENGVLSAAFDNEIGAATLTVMTAEQRKELITDPESRSSLSDEEKAVGIGLLWDLGEVQLIMVLDIE